MLDPAKYWVDEKLRTGHWVVIRSLRPEDRADLVAAVNRTSARSLYRRFFGLKHHFSENEKDFFLKIDFTNHVALVAIVREVGRPAIVGGARYVVARSGTAEVAFTVVDKYQGRGIGSLLMRHLATIARDVGLRELTAEVLPENTPMIRVFEKSGLGLRTTQEEGVVHVALKLL